MGPDGLFSYHYFHFVLCVTNGAVNEAGFSQCPKIILGTVKRHMIRSNEIFYFAD